MTTIALWTNILAFTFLTSSIALSFIVRLRKRHAWFDWYLVYACCYACWTLIYALFFFLLSYEISPSPVYSTITAYTRLMISCVIMYSLPMMIRGFESNVRRKKALMITGIIFAALFLILGLSMYMITNRVFLALINIFSNLLLCSLSIYGLIASRHSRVRSATIMAPPVLYVSICFYFLAMLTGLALLIFRYSSPVISSFAVSAYCIPWAIAAMTSQAVFIVGKTSKNGLLPAALVADYRLTPRESDIVSNLAEGRSNSEIADLQCISLKTVETHLYNVYRKTNVRNRVELVNRIDIYRTEQNHK